ncbi:MAG TPA: 3,4-dihydroxy-2-butanone-4-phosphate synthase [Nitrososphaera sp.]|nr:3,4-dihydroxy-2-butanone-4-phosphate synthase [Nitrososphaera sp.]
MSLNEAIAALKAAKMVLVYDGKGRENEVDMVVAAEHMTPEYVASMRKDAGGLLCLAISHEVATKLGLAYMHDMIASFGKLNPVFTKLTQGKAAYGDKPSFSIWINHRDTFTGITDNDRALTITKMASVCRNIETTGVEEFSNGFRAPGHVPILIASKRLLEERMGHTELCVYMTKLAGISPAIVMCEMMDSNTHKALSVQDAKKYAMTHGLSLVDASELKAHAKVT